MSPATDKKPGALTAAGFVRDPSSGTARRYRDTEGRLGKKGAVVSYRAAFINATGKTFEQASRVIGKYPEYADARVIRNAARYHQFVAQDVMTEKEERRIARMTLKQMTKGHFDEGGGLSGLFPDVFGEGRDPTFRRGPAPHRLDFPGGDEGNRMYLAERNAWLGFRPQRSAYPHGPQGATEFEKHYDAWWQANGPQSRKARFLVAIGRRTGDEEYAVGETP